MRSDGTAQGLADLLKFVESKVKQHWGCLVEWRFSHLHLGGVLVELQHMRDELSGVVEVNEEMWHILETRTYVPAPPPGAELDLEPELERILEMPI